MALEDFERELEAEKSKEHKRKRHRSRSPDEKHRSHHRKRSHGSRSHHSKDDQESRHRSRKSKHRHRDRSRSPAVINGHGDVTEAGIVQGKELADSGGVSTSNAHRDSWMEAPSALDVDYVQGRKKQEPASTFVKSADDTFKQHLHARELEHHLADVEQEDPSYTVDDLPAEHEVNYMIGDEGSSWRMTKLRATYKLASGTKRSLEDVARERYGNLRAFDDAREEEIELDRRETYGKGYIGKEKPNGDLFQERKLDAGIHRPARQKAADNEESEDEFEKAQGGAFNQQAAHMQSVPLDQTALNKLKGQMMKAKLTKSANAAELEAQYNAAVAGAANNKQSDVVVLNKMESRLLAGGRQGEVNSIDNKRGRERGLVQENEDMSIDDMVRQERRTRGQGGGEGRAFAERIAKDGKFDNDLDYMDDNAAKLAKSVQKSEINLRNTAIGDYHKMKRILDTCPLCHHEDTNAPPQAPIVSLATRTFLTLPTAPEITPYGFCATIVPVQHRLNLLECDDDEWEEIRNFMKCLTRFYYSQKPSRSVIFYENAAHEGRKRHASLEAVPLPMKHAETAPAFFKEAILAADEEWTQHKKVIDTLDKATEGGLGKLAFRRSMVSKLPYFHVWFMLDGGLGHVVEDPRRWPKGDLFAREIFGGILDQGPEIVKKQGRWRKGDSEMKTRVEKFRAGWKKHDWTKSLLEAD